MILPQFIAIGAHRCGTTYLYDNLLTHPDLYLPRRKKELHFFNEDANYERGLEYHASSFENAGTRMAGEVTPSYLTAEPAAQRIHDALPEARLIVMLRDPVERAFSHYGLFRSNIKAYQRLSFEETLERKWEELVGEGEYWRHLERYFELFPKEQVHVIIFEEMVEKPVDHFRKLYDFLGADPDHKSPFLGKKTNSHLSRGYNARSRTLARVARGLKRVRMGNIAYSLERLNRSSAKKVELKPETAEKLRSQFASHNEKLRSLLGISLDDWG